MTLTMPDFSNNRVRDTVKNIAYVVVAILVAAILMEAMLLKTLNLVLLEALSAVMLMF